MRTSISVQSQDSVPPAPAWMLRGSIGGVEPPAQRRRQLQAVEPADDPLRLLIDLLRRGWGRPRTPPSPPARACRGSCAVQLLTGSSSPVRRFFSAMTSWVLLGVPLVPEILAPPLGVRSPGAASRPASSLTTSPIWRIRSAQDFSFWMDSAYMDLLDGMGDRDAGAAGPDGRRRAVRPDRQPREGQAGGRVRHMGVIVLARASPFQVVASGLRHGKCLVILYRGARPTDRQAIGLQANLCRAARTSTRS